MGAEDDERDISIAHRLPSRNSAKSVIARFARRTKKIEMPGMKNNLKDSQCYRNVKVI